MALSALLSCLVSLTGCAGTQHHMPLAHLGASTFSFAPVGGEPVPDVPSCSGESIDARLDCFVAALAPRAASMGVDVSIAVVSGDRVLARTLGEGVTPDSTFAIASVSKMMLSIALMTLVEEGRVDLHTPIREYLPSLHEGSPVGAITLDQLLTHTAGLPVELDCDGASDDMAEIATSVGDLPLWAPPGVAHEYSNVGYTMIAAVVEHVTGQRYEDVVRERVFEPLGMTNAIYELPAGDTGSRVVGLDLEGHPVGVDSRLCRGARASGGVMASALDLTHVAQMLLAHGGDRLRSESLDAMIAGVETGQPHGERYGYALVRMPFGDMTLIQHSGRLVHFGSFLAVVPEHDLGVVVLVNRHTLPATTVFAAIDTLLGLPATPQTTVPLAGTLDALTGCYRDDAGRLGLVAITREGEGLVADMIGPTRTVLAPTGTFFAVGAESAEYLATSLGIAHRTSASVCVSAGGSD